MASVPLTTAATTARANASDSMSIATRPLPRRSCDTAFSNVGLARLHPYDRSQRQLTMLTSMEKTSRSSRERPLQVSYHLAKCLGVRFGHGVLLSRAARNRVRDANPVDISVGRDFGLGAEHAVLAEQLPLGQIFFARFHNPASNARARFDTFLVALFSLQQLELKAGGGARGDRDPLFLQYLHHARANLLLG